MADISKVTLPSGTTYDLKDATARQLIADLSNYTAFLGVTTTALTDGATTNPITIGGSSVTATTGNIVTYNSKEFIFNGTAWQEFGDLSGLGALAYKDSASGTFTPSGSVSQPTFTGTQGSVSVSGTAVTAVSHELDSASASGTDTVLKDVTNAAPTFSGTQKYLHLSTTKGTVTSTGNFTPAGTNSAPTFTGTEATIRSMMTGSGMNPKPNGGIPAAVQIGIGTTEALAVTAADNSIAYGDEAAVYTPTGTVSTPTITVTPTTATKYSITGVGSMPTFSATVSNEILTLGWTAGSVPTRSSFTAVTGISSATASQPTFTGEAKYFAAVFDSAYGVTGTFTPSGTVSAPTFTGTQGSVSVSTTDAVTAVSGSVNTTASGGIDIKPAGTVTAPTLTKTYVKPKVTATSGAVTSTGNYTPAGTVSQPTFTGTQGNVSVS